MRVTSLIGVAYYLCGSILCFYAGIFLSWVDTTLLIIVALTGLLLLKVRPHNRLEFIFMLTCTSLVYVSRLPVRHYVSDSGVYYQDTLNYLLYIAALFSIALILLPLFAARREGVKFTLRFSESVILICLFLFLLYSLMVIFIGFLMSLTALVNPFLFLYFAATVGIVFSGRLLFSLEKRLQGMVFFLFLVPIATTACYKIVTFAGIYSDLNKVSVESATLSIEEKREIYKRVIDRNRYLQWNDFSVQTHQQLGVLCFKNREFQEAEKNFGAVLKHERNNLLSLMGRGMALYHGGNQKEAIRTFRHVTSQATSFDELKSLLEPDIEILNLLGVMYMEEGKLDQALNILEGVFETDSTRSDTAFFIGSIYTSKKNGKEGIRFLNRAEELGYRSPELHYRLGLLYADMGRWPKVIKATQKAISISPTYLDAYELLEQAAEKAGREGLFQKINRAKMNILPKQRLAEVKTQNIELLGYSLQKQEFRQGEAITIHFFSRILRNLASNQEDIYLLLGNPPEITLRNEFNVLEQMNKKSRLFYVGDIVRTTCTIDGRTLLPGLCELSYYLPGDVRLDKKDKDRPSNQVDNSDFRRLCTFQIVPHVYRRISFGPEKVPHIFDDGLEHKYLKTYFYLANRHSIDVPVLRNPMSFKVSSLIMISSLTFSGEMPQKSEIARLIIIDNNDKEYVWHVRAGIDSSEWAWDFPGMRIAHKRAPIAYSWKVSTFGPDFDAHKYYRKFVFEEPVFIKSIRMQYVAHTGCIEVCDLIYQGHGMNILKKELSLVDNGKNSPVFQQNERGQDD